MSLPKISKPLTSRELRDRVLAQTKEDASQAAHRDSRREMYEPVKKTLREAAAELLHQYDLWAEDANDGEFAMWSSDHLVASFAELRRALGQE